MGSKVKKSKSKSYTIAHLSDLHLGYRDKASLGRVTPDVIYDGMPIPVREFDGYKAWNDVIDGVIADNVDAVIIAGDIGHEPNPSNRARQHMIMGLSRLANAGIPVYNITGNHDVNDIPSDVAFTANLHRPEVGIYSHANPYQVYNLNDDIVVHMVSHHMYNESVDVMKKVRPVKGAVNILTTHGSLVDPLINERIRVNETVREVIIPEYFLNDNWDAMMLGHIHERGYIGKKSDGIYYNGSLIRRGFADAEGPLGRGYTLWHIHDDGSVTQEMRTVWQRPQVDLPPIHAEELNSTALTEALLRNLPEITDGMEYDPAVAPILRQRVIGATPSVFAARDQQAITEASKYALSYDLAPRAAENKPSKEIPEPEETSKVQVGAGTLEASYSDWVKDSKTIQDIPDAEAREHVATMGAGYLRRGVEKVFEESIS